MEEQLSTWQCPSCSCTGNTGRFCTQCGHPRPMMEWICQACGHASNTGKFCMSCGAPQSTDATDISYCEKTPEPSYVHPSTTTLPPSETESQSPNRKGFLIAIAIAAFAVSGYFGYNLYIEKQYDKQCDDLATTTSEIGQSIDRIAELSGNGESDDTKALSQKIDDEINKLEQLHESFLGLQAPDEKKVHKKDLTEFIEADKEVLSKANQILKNTDFVIDRKSGEKLDIAYNEFKTALQNAQNIENPTIHGQEIKELSGLERMDKSLQEYIKKKLSRDHAAYLEKLKSYQIQLNNSNDALKQKNELVFLPREVVISGQDLLVRGVFYNGTSDRITGLKQMSIDLTLKQFDEEVLSIKDFPIQEIQYTRMFLPPKSTASWITTLRLPGKAIGIEAYNNFALTAHDIHWIAIKMR